MHSVTTHVIYWDPNKEFTATTTGIVGKFFADVGHDKELASNVFAVGGQYKDATGHAAYSSTFATEGTDLTVYPASGCVIPNEVDKGPPYTSCITDTQLKEELSAYISANSLPTGPTQQYFVLLPHKVVTCLPEEEVSPGVFVRSCSNNFYCAYHSSINGGASNEIIYSDIPFSLLDSTFGKGCQNDGNGAVQHPNGDIVGSDTTTKYADVALKYTSHEYIEAATDPLGSAYFDANGLEIGDKCNGVSPDETEDGIGYDANSFLPTLGGSESPTLFTQSINSGSYYLQSEWDNGAKACRMKPLALSSASFMALPTAGVAGAPIGFKGTATDPYGGLGFTWKWGDGTESAGVSPTHIYALPGTYEVTMTPKDELTDSTTTPVVHMVIVNDVPTASFSISQNPVSEGVAVEFNGGGSKDPDGSIESYTWNFGDGSAAGSGPTPSHTYDTRGTYTVTLTVTDSGKQTVMTTHSVTVTGVPKPVTEAASSLGQTSATLNATVNPNGGEVSECKFEYGATTSYGSSVRCSSLPGSGSSPVAVSASVTGLTANTIYHFRISATNPGGTSAGVDQTFTTLLNPSTPTAIATLTPMLTPVPTPSSNFSALGAALDQRTGAITFTESVGDPGTLSWLITFQNGKFGAFTARKTKCKKGQVNLSGKCRPSAIVFGKGRQTVATPGTVTFMAKPSASGLKALRNALKQKKGLPVTATFTFQSSHGGGPISHTQSLNLKLKRSK